MGNRLARWRVSAVKPGKRDGGSWRLRYRPPQGGGRPYTRSSKLRTGDQARALAALEEARLNAAILGPGATPSSALLAYATAKEAEGAAPLSLAGWRSTAKRLAPLLGPPTAAAIRRARDQLLADGLRPVTVNGHMERVASAWRWAHERGYVVRPWPAVRPLRERGTRKRPYAPEEAAQVLAWLREQRPLAYPPLLLIWDAGSRLGETLALQGEDLDRERCVVHFRRRTKGGRRRVEAVSPEVVAAIRPACAGETLWPGRRGRVIGERTVRSSLTAALRALGLPVDELDVHSLRRAQVADLHRAGAGLFGAMRRVGHRSVRVHKAYQDNALWDHEADRELLDLVRGLRGPHLPAALPPEQARERVAGDQCKVNESGDLEGVVECEPRRGSSRAELLASLFRLGALGLKDRTAPGAPEFGLAELRLSDCGEWICNLPCLVGGPGPGGPVS